MITKAYCLLDVKAGVFSLPWFFFHDAQVYRAVEELGADKNTTVGKYPEDFVLFCVGSFDDVTGVLERCSPVSMGPVSSLLRG